MNKNDKKMADIDGSSKNIEFIYSVIKQRIDAEFDALDKKDQKASTLFALDGVLLAIIFNLHNSIHCFCLFYIGVAFLFASLILAFVGYKVAKWKMDPEPSKFYDKYRNNKDYIATIEQTIVNMNKNYEENKEKTNKKGIFINYGFTTSIVGILFVFLSIFI